MLLPFIFLLSLFHFPSSFASFFFNLLFSCCFFHWGFQFLFVLILKLYFMFFQHFNKYFFSFYLNSVLVIFPPILLSIILAFFYSPFCLPVSIFFFLSFLHFILLLHIFSHSPRIPYLLSSLSFNCLLSVSTYVQSRYALILLQLRWFF